MIVTEKFSMTHLPKTGGSWLKKQLADIITVKEGARPHVPARYDPNLPHYGVFRDPVEWYCSLISFSYRGSECSAPLHDPICEVLRTLTIRSYMEALLDPTPEMKAKIAEVISLWKGKWSIRGMLGLYEGWLATHLDFYSFVANEHLGLCDEVVQFENLREESARLLRKHGYETQAGLVETAAPHNVTMAKLIIPEDIQVRIRKSCAEVSERFGRAHSQ